MPQPGIITHGVPDGLDAVWRAIRELQQTIREGTAGNDAQAMQVGIGGIIVDGGGSITVEGGGSLNVSSGVLNTSGQITTNQGVIAGGAVESGNGAGVMDASGNVTGKAGSFSSISATGQVSSASALKSQGTYNYVVATSYKAVWIDGSTFQLGYSPSSEVVKTELTAMSSTDVEKLLGLTPYWGLYVWDPPGAPPRVFLLAADVQAAGFGPDIAPIVEGTEPLVMVDTNGQPILDANGSPCTVPVGEAYTINYSQMVVPLLAAVKQLSSDVAAIKTKLGMS